MENRRIVYRTINTGSKDPVVLELTEGLLEEFKREGFEFWEDRKIKAPTQIAIAVSEDFRDVAERLILSGQFPIEDFLDDHNIDELREEYLLDYDDYFDLTDYVLQNYKVSELDLELDPYGFGWRFNEEHNIWYYAELIF